MLALRSERRNHWAPAKPSQCFRPRPIIPADADGHKYPWHGHPCLGRRPEGRAVGRPLKAASRTVPPHPRASIRLVSAARSVGPPPPGTVGRWHQLGEGRTGQIAFVSRHRMHIGVVRDAAKKIASPRLGGESHRTTAAKDDSFSAQMFSLMTFRRVPPHRLGAIDIPGRTRYASPGLQPVKRWKRTMSATTCGRVRSREGYCPTRVSDPHFGGSVGLRSSCSGQEHPPPSGRKQHTTRGKAAALR